MKAFLDTSILASYYCPEPRSKHAQQVLSGIENASISPLVEIEFYCVIARKVRANEIDIPFARRILVEFRRHLSESRFHIIPIKAGEYTLAGQWIGGFTSSLRSVDALHLAAASNNDLTLLTADKILAAAARRFDVKQKLIP